MSAPTLHALSARIQRSDGAEARARILYAALALFAAKGFAKTSTREIATAAGANIAAISYYFGDKAGLYAATFTEPMGGNAGDLITLIDVPGLPIEQTLRVLMTAYLEPLKHGEIVRQCMRLHLREMIEPTSQWPTEFERDVKGPHEALVRALCRHLQLTQPDDDVHRLALAVSGLAMQLFVMQDVIDGLAPSLLDTPQHIDTWSDRLVTFAIAMVAAETERRATAGDARHASSARRAPRTPSKRASRTTQTPSR
ncbi:hypothetical protein BH11PSE13_BH11PSE13_30680 [soil metagenome]